MKMIEKLAAAFNTSSWSLGIAKEARRKAGSSPERILFEPLEPRLLLSTVGIGGGYDFASIQDAIDAASPGETINVAAGTYTEYLHITTDDLTLQGAGMDLSIIDLEGLTPYWHYRGQHGGSASRSYASRAGVLITGYGSPDQIIEGVTFTGFTVKNAGLNPPVTATGTHTGADDAAVLTDSTASWVDDELIGQWVHNYSDRDTDYNPARSYGQITDNDATTLTVNLTSGKENDWDTGDAYIVSSYEHFYDQFYDYYRDERGPREGLRGIAIANGKDILIQDCKVENNGYGGISGTKPRCIGQIYNEGITVDSCIVKDHYAAGIGIGGLNGTATITNNVVENNKSLHVADTSREYRGYGIEVVGRSKTKMASGVISGNTVKNNGFEGIILKSYSDGVIVENNTVTGHNFDQDGAGIFFYGKSSNPAYCKNNIIRNNTLRGNIRGIVAYYAQGGTIEGNTIATDSGSFPEGQEGIKLDGGNNILVKDNHISCDGVGIGVSNTWNGIHSYDNTITGNTIKRAKFAGIRIRAGAHDNTFTYNTITDTRILTRWAGAPYEETQGDGVIIDDSAGPDNVFHYNTIQNNDDDGMENQLATTVDAEFNYWGDGSGPTHSSNPGGTGDAVSDNVDYSPWLGNRVGSRHVIFHTNDDIQGAVDEAGAGDTILVHPGTYNGFTVVGKDGLAIEPEGSGDVTVTGSVSLATYRGTYNLTIGVMDSTDIEIRGFNVVAGYTDPFTIAYFNSTGVITECETSGNTGNANPGNGIAAFGITNPGTVKITNNYVHDYGKIGILVNSWDPSAGDYVPGGIYAEIRDNTIVGTDFADYYRVQDGIQITYGGSAKIMKNDISGNFQTGGSAWTSDGIMMYEAYRVRTRKNRIYNNQMGITAQKYVNSWISYHDKITDNEWGIYTYNWIPSVIEINHANITDNDYGWVNWDTDGIVFNWCKLEGNDIGMYASAWRTIDPAVYFNVCKVRQNITTDVEHDSNTMYFHNTQYDTYANYGGGVLIES